MFDVNELLSKNNQKLAFAHLSQKDGCGIDGLRVSELPEFWKSNSKKIIEDIKQCKYKPGTVLMREIVNSKGKRRTICSLPSLDRLITRLLSQKLERYISPMFYDNSFAYQENKGTTAAVMKAKEYIDSGDKFVVEIDIKDFFDSISLIRMQGSEESSLPSMLNISSFFSSQKS